MQFEYQMLTIMTIFFTLAWLPSSVGKFFSYGGKWVMGNRAPIQGKELLPWAGRVERAYTNLKDYFPAFVVAILVLGLMGKFDEGTKIAAGTFVAARLAHFIVYAFGISLLRALTFFAGLGANLYLLFKILL
jgi:uncharacterized MAPEG superfamily protein